MESKIVSMAMDDEGLRLANGSGFPFQLRVAHEIEQAPGWSVIQEHPWQHTVTSDKGFIDLIASCGATRLVIECKRVGGVWLFLATHNSSRTRRVRGYCTSRARSESNIQLWADLDAEPESWEVGFCVVHGQTESNERRQTPMLERIGGGILRSTEALANEELYLNRTRTSRDRFVYLPVIVTAASLHVCHFAPEAVKLETGRLEASATTFFEVPMVRFRKALDRGADQSLQSVEEAHEAGQRTVLVVRADFLGRMLEEWGLAPQGGGDWPQSLVLGQRRMQQGPGV